MAARDPRRGRPTRLDGGRLPAAQLARSSPPAARSPSSVRASSGRRRRGSPPLAQRRPSTVTISGTGFVEWAVLGEPSGSSMWSALPWSAVTMQAPPAPCTASTTSPRHASTVSTAVDRRRDDAGVADHVRVGEVDDPEAVAVAAASARTNASAAARGAHLGLARRRWRRRAATAPGGAPRPPTRLPPAVEEVGDVRVLLGLGDVQLALAALGDHLGQRHLGARGGNATG